MTTNERTTKIPIAERAWLVLGQLASTLAERCQERERTLRAARMDALFPRGTRVRLVLPYADDDARHVWTIARYHADSNDYTLTREGPRGPTECIARVEVLRRAAPEETLS